MDLINYVTEAHICWKMWVVARSRLSRVSFINSQKYHFEWCHPQQVVRSLDKSQYLMTPFSLSMKLVAIFNENDFLAKE